MHKKNTKKNFFVIFQIQNLEMDVDINLDEYMYSPAHRDFLYLNMKMGNFVYSADTKQIISIFNQCKTFGVNLSYFIFSYMNYFLCKHKTYTNYFYVGLVFLWFHLYRSKFVFIVVSIKNIIILMKNIMIFMLHSIILVVVM